MNNDKFKNVFETKYPPDLYKLKQIILKPNESSNSNNIGAPNYNRIIKIYEPNMESKSQFRDIFRISTGRDAYQQEQYISIYDSNFGGLLGTNLGLK